jgi:hypothetical protein
MILLSSSRQFILLLFFVFIFYFIHLLLHCTFLVINPLPTLPSQSRQYRACLPSLSQLPTLGFPRVCVCVPASRQQLGCWPSFLLLVLLGRLRSRACNFFFKVCESFGFLLLIFQLMWTESKFFFVSFGWIVVVENLK